jgi:translocation protein SEC63
MGIALPRWIVEAHNNAWVLAFYGSLFGVGLPIVVVCIFFWSREFEIGFR